MDWRNNVVAPVLSAIAVSAIYFSIDFFRKAPGYYVLPQGAVVAFNLTRCPDGWNTFYEARGRTIIGIGKGTQSEYTLGQHGGSETHTLTIGELPKHSHSNWPLVKKFQTGGSAGAIAYDEGQGDRNGVGDTGENQPHNIMQPWIALRYCEKI